MTHSQVGYDQSHVRHDSFTCVSRPVYIKIQAQTHYERSVTGDYESNACVS